MESIIKAPTQHSHMNQQEVLVSTKANIFEIYVKLQNKIRNIQNIACITQNAAS